MNHPAVISLQNVHKFYRSGERRLHVLRGISMEVRTGEYVAIMGPSGSGKSTMLNLLGLLDVADAGTYILAGEDVSRMPEHLLSRLRNRQIGFVFQSFNLFQQLTVQQNIEVPMSYGGVPILERRRRARMLAERVGLSERLHHRPMQLSGGEMQRVAIARAMANQPSLILADEPTGNLDEATGEEVLRLFEELVSQGTSIILVTHNPSYRARVQKVLQMKGGELFA
ncbi:MAG TPA: ABC transporter ATP-binding protein [Tepidisphaeraceae bacterium]|mgnify:CR=1 FL=1|nr:ABC transporter ATP-binding protein [Tepidisphaeraceae bacterium]